VTAEHAIATNATALRNLATRLERLGYTGDTYAEAERIAVNLALDGYRPLDPPVPTQGAGSTEAARRDALAIAEAAVRAAKEKGGRL
jgi:hypothetical protein